MTPRRQQHLKEIAERYGTGNGTRVIVEVVEAGLEAQRAAEQKQRAAEGREQKINPYVTDAGKCPRKVYLSLRNVEPTNPPTTDSLINFGIGHAVEEWLAEILDAQGAKVQREVRVEIPAPHGVVVSGRADFMAVTDELDALVELKTTSSRSMGFMIRKNEPGKDDHRRQLNLYLHASQLGLLDKPRTRGLLVYAVKDATKGEPPLHAFEVVYDEAMATADLQSLSIIAQNAERGWEIGVPANYDRNRYPCSYCDFRSFCWDQPVGATA